MAYEVLARKWRPTTFDAMVGQEHVLRALANALAGNRLHHAYLFTGTRGVGKTTVARILARCLNCETGVTATPCGTCTSCVEIGEGRFVDLIEVDAASRSRVEETRDLMENVQYAPARGRFKVYLIDEVHMLSTASFNALLKTLEEPPPHVKFLLATTDPKKLPVTVLSRCLQFHLKNLTPERIVGHLQHVLAEETVPADEDALWALARAADGSMRDALSLTDQAIAFGDGQLVGTDVARMLGTIDQGAMERILRALAEADGEALLACCQDLAGHGADFAAVLRDLMSALHRIAVVQALPAASSGVAAGGDRSATLHAELAAVLLPEDVQLYYQIALTGHRDLPHAPDPQTGFEMTLLRMLAFRPEEPGEERQTPPARSSEGPAAPRGESAGTTPAPARAEHAAEPAGGDTTVAASRWQEPDHSAHLADLRALAADNSWRGHESSVASARQPQSEVAPVEHRPAAAPANVEQLDRWRERAAPTPAPQPLPPRSEAPDAASASGERSAASQAGEAAGSEPAEPAREPVAEARPAAGVPRSPETLPEYWHQVLAELDLGGLTATLATHCLPLAVDSGRVRLALDPAAETLNAGMHGARLEAALSEYYGTSLSVEIAVAEPEAETPAQRAAREKAERQAAAESAIASDQVVRSLMDTFNAQLQPGSVRPLGK